MMRCGWNICCCSLNECVGCRGLFDVVCVGGLLCVDLMWLLMCGCFYVDD